MPKAAKARARKLAAKGATGKANGDAASGVANSRLGDKLGPKKEVAAKAGYASLDFVVVSESGYTPDGFHAPEDPETTVIGVCSSKEQANKLVRASFFDKNPWGWTKEDFENRDTEERCVDGLLELNLFCGDGERWSVRAKASAMKAKSGAKGTNKSKAKASASLHGKSSASSKESKSYVVLGRAEHPPDGFHSYCPSDSEALGICSSIEEANKLVRSAFIKSNPWGWRKVDFEDRAVEEKVRRDGTLHLRVHPPDSEVWEVWAAAGKAGTKKMSDETG